jgi:putative SOS response-associated peptidase YedK
MADDRLTQSSLRVTKRVSASKSAIAMKDGAPFGIAGIWENWKDPTSGEWVRTFAIITTDANELVADIHDRMPVILARSDYTRWLGEEPDPRDLMRPFPAKLMRMWPIS